jgi:hypothetical protein
MVLATPTLANITTNAQREVSALSIHPQGISGGIHFQSCDLAPPFNIHATISAQSEMMYGAIHNSSAWGENPIQLGNAGHIRHPSIPATSHRSIVVSSRHIRAA